MIIYATPFTHSTGECTGPSVDSGFKSIQEVINVLGTPDVQDSTTLIIYGKTDSKVLYSQCPFRIDHNDNIE